MTERNQEKKRKISGIVEKSVIKNINTGTIANGKNEITAIFEISPGNSINSEGVKPTHPAVRKIKRHSESPKSRPAICAADEVPRNNKSYENKRTSKMPKKTRNEHGKPTLAENDIEIIRTKQDTSLDTTPIPAENKHGMANKVRHSRSPKHKHSTKKATEDPEEMMDILEKNENKDPILKQSKLMESEHFFTRVGEWLKNSIVSNISYSLKQNDQNLPFDEEVNVDNMSANTKSQKKVNSTEVTVIHEHSEKIRSKHNTYLANTITEDVRNELNHKIKTSKIMKGHENTINPKDIQKLPEGKKDFVERPISPTPQNKMLANNNRGSHGKFEIQAEAASSGISDRMAKNKDKQNGDKKKRKSSPKHYEKSEKHTSPEKFRMNAANKNNHTLSPEHSKKISEKKYGKDKEAQVNSPGMKQKSSRTPKASTRQDKTENVDENSTKHSDKKERSISLSPTLLRKSSASETSKIPKKIPLNHEKMSNSRKKGSEKHKDSMYPKTSEINDNKERDMTKIFPDKSGDYLHENFVFPVMIEEHSKHDNRLAKKPPIPSNLEKRIASASPERPQYKTNTDLTLMDSKSLKICYKTDKKIKSKENAQTKPLLNKNDNNEILSPEKSGGKREHKIHNSYSQRKSSKHQKNMDYDTPTITGNLLFDTKSIHKSSKSIRHEIKLTNKPSNGKNKKKSSHKSKVSHLVNETETKSSHMSKKNIEEKIMEIKKNKNSSQKKNLDKVNEIKNISNLEKFSLQTYDTHEKLSSARNMLTEESLEGEKSTNDDIICMYSKAEKFKTNCTKAQFTEAMRLELIKFNEHISQDSKYTLPKCECRCSTSHSESEEQEFKLRQCSIRFKNVQYNEHCKCSPNNFQMSSNETYNLPPQQQQQQQQCRCKTDASSIGVPQSSAITDTVNQSANTDNNKTKNTKIVITDSFSNEQEIRTHIYNKSLTSYKSAISHSLSKIQQEQTKSNIPESINQSSINRSNQIDKNKSNQGSHSSNLPKKKIIKLDKHVHNSCPLLSQNDLKNHFLRRSISLPDFIKTKQKNHIFSISSIRNVEISETDFPKYKKENTCGMGKKSFNTNLKAKEPEKRVLKKHTETSESICKQIVFNKDNVRHQHAPSSPTMKENLTTANLKDDILFHFKRKKRIRNGAEDYRAHDLSSDHHAILDFTKYKTDSHNETVIQSKSALIQKQNGVMDNNIEKSTTETVSQIHLTEFLIKDNHDIIVVSKTNISTTTKKVNINSMDDTKTNCITSSDKIPSQFPKVFTVVTKAAELIENISNSDLQNLSKNETTKTTDKFKLEDIQTGQVQINTGSTFSTENNFPEKSISLSNTMIENKENYIQHNKSFSSQENINSKLNIMISEHEFKKDNIEVIFPIKHNFLQSQTEFNTIKDDEDKYSTSMLYHEPSGSENKEIIVSNSSEKLRKRYMDVHCVDSKHSSPAEENSRTLRESRHTEESKLKEDLSNRGIGKNLKDNNGTCLKSDNLQSQSAENMSRLELSDQFQKAQEVCIKQAVLNIGALYTTEISTSSPNEQKDNLDVLSTENDFKNVNLFNNKTTNPAEAGKTESKHDTFEDNCLLEDYFSAWWTYIKNEVLTETMPEFISPNNDYINITMDKTNKNQNHKDNFTPKVPDRNNAMPGSISRNQSSMKSAALQKVNKPPFITVGKYTLPLFRKIIEAPRHDCLSRRGFVAEQMQNAVNSKTNVKAKKTKSPSEASNKNKECAVCKRNEATQGKRVNNFKSSIPRNSEKQNKAQNEKENINSLQMKSKLNELNKLRSSKYHTNYPITSNKPPPAHKIHINPKSFNDDSQSATSQESRIKYTYSKTRRKNNDGEQFIGGKLSREKSEVSEDSRSYTSQDSQSFSLKTREFNYDSFSITSQESRPTSTSLYSKAKSNMSSQQSQREETNLSKYSSDSDRKRGKLINSKPGQQNTSRFQQQTKETKVPGNERNKTDNQVKENCTPTTASNKQKKYPWKPKQGPEDKKVKSEISEKFVSKLKRPYIPLIKKAPPKRKPSVDSSKNTDQDVTNSETNKSENETNNSIEKKKSSETMKIELNVYGKSDEYENLPTTKKEEFTIDISEEPMPKSNTEIGTNNTVSAVPSAVRNIISKVTIDVKLEQRAEGSDVKKEICIKSSTSFESKGTTTKIYNVTTNAGSLSDNKLSHTFPFSLGSVSEPNCSLSLQDNTRKTSNDTTSKFPTFQKSDVTDQQQAIIENPDMPLLKLKPLEQSRVCIQEIRKETESSIINSVFCDLRTERESLQKTTIEKFENCICNECKQLPEEAEISLTNYEYCNLHHGKGYNRLNRTSSFDPYRNYPSVKYELNSKNVQPSLRCPSEEVEETNKTEIHFSKNAEPTEGCQCTSEIPNSEKSQKEFKIHPNLNRTRNGVGSEAFKLPTKTEKSLFSLYLNPTLQQKMGSGNTDDSTEIQKTEPKSDKSFSDTSILEFANEEYCEKYKNEINQQTMNEDHNSSSINLIKSMSSIMKIYPFLEEDATKLMCKENGSLLSKPVIPMTQLQFPFQSMPPQPNENERCTLPLASLISLNHDIPPSDKIISEHTVNLQSTKSTQMMDGSGSTAPLMISTYVQFPEDVLCNTITEKITKRIHTKSTEYQSCNTPSVPVIVLSRVQLPIDNELSSLNLEQDYSTDSFVFEEEVQAIDTQSQSSSKTGKNLLKTTQQDGKLFSSVPMMTSGHKRFPEDKVHLQPILEQGMHNLPKETTQSSSGPPTPAMIFSLLTNNIKCNPDMEQEKDDNCMKSPHSEDISPVVTISQIQYPITLNLNNPAQSAQMEDKSFLSLPVIALSQVPFPMNEIIVYQATSLKGKNKSKKKKDELAGEHNPDDRHVSDESSRKTKMFMKKNVGHQKKKSDEETDSSLNHKNKQKGGKGIANKESVTSEASKDKTGKDGHRKRKASKPDKHSEFTSTEETDDADRIDKSKLKKALPTLEKIPVTEWDKGMYDIPSEEELNALKNLPTEYSTAIAQTKKRGSETPQGSLDKLTSRRLSFQQDKRITFDASDKGVHRFSSSLSNMSPRTESPMEQKSSSLTDKQSQGNTSPEGKKSKRISSFFAKFKRFCCRQKQVEVPEYSTYEEDDFELEQLELQQQITSSAPSKAPKVKFFSSDENLLLPSFQSSSLELAEVEEVEIEYDVEPWEVGYCLRQGFRADGLALSGEICIGQKKEPLTEGVPVINLSDTLDPATFLYRLGINVDKAEAMFVKDANLNGRIHAALTEATVWADQITKIQAVLLLHLAQKTKPSIIGWYPHLVEAIVNNRIQSAMKLNGFLQKLENSKEDKVGQYSKTFAGFSLKSETASRRDSYASTYSAYKYDPNQQHMPERKRRPSSAKSNKKEDIPEGADSKPEKKGKRKKSVSASDKEKDISISQKEMTQPSDSSEIQKKEKSISRTEIAERVKASQEIDMKVKKRRMLKKESSNRFGSADKNKMKS